MALGNVMAMVMAMENIKRRNKLSRFFKKYFGVVNKLDVAEILAPLHARAGKMIKNENICILVT